jgi:proteasome assembly chaperone (PAC2) family protein
MSQCNTAPGVLTVDLPGTNSINTGTLYAINPNTGYAWANAGAAIGSNGYDWNTSSINPSATIQLKGESADILINEKSLMKTLDKIEQRLGILQPNPELESEWEELRELATAYRELEAKLLEKKKMWAALQK